MLDGLSLHKRLFATIIPCAMTIRCLGCQTPIDPSSTACATCGEPVTDFLRRYLQEPIDGKYEILERLGAGGMGEVFKVRHIMLGVTRVVKVIRANISASTDASDRFLREARLATRVQQSNVATLHDFSALPDGSHYMVWEFIDGQNLAQRIRAAGKLAPRQAVRIAVQALHGLEAIHRAGIVHRDISPENIMLTRESSGEESVKIIDLGVAKAEGGDSATQTGMFIGKLRYASPEQLGFLPEGERIDGRSDLYSLAVVLYEMLAGRPPFDATSPHEYLLIHSREQEFRPLDLPADLPGGAGLQSVMKRALERDRNKRFATAAEFATALDTVARSLPDPRDDATLITAPAAKKASRTAIDPNPQPQKRRPTSLAVLGSLIAIVIVAIGAILFVLLRSTPPRVATATKPPAPAAASAPAAVTASTASAAPVEVVPSTVTTATIATTEPPPVIEPPAPSTAPPVATATVPTKRQRPRRRETKRPALAPVVAAPQPPPPEPPREAPRLAGKFVEGGNSDANDSIVAAARRELGSPSQIAIRGTGDAAQTSKLVDLLKSNVTISDSANVIVDFNGTVQRRGFGRKQRAATATVSKDGQAVFQYEMRPEVYRVGDDPADAFARVLRELLGR